MSKSKIINTADEQLIKAAIAQPHGLVYIDKVLMAKTDGYMMQLTLGWKTPQDTYSPVATVSIPVPFAKVLANELLALEEDAVHKRENPDD